MQSVDFEKLQTLGKVTGSQSWCQAFEIKFYYDTKEVACATFQIIFTPLIRGDFFYYLDELSHELAQLALLFDNFGCLKNSVIQAGTGCWSSTDAQKIQSSSVVYMEELVVAEEWREQGIGSWILNNVFNLPKIKEIPNMPGFIFVWPTVLNHLEKPHSGGPFGNPTPQEIAAYNNKAKRIVKFYRKAGFRRVGTSFFFCLARDFEHASRRICLEDDAEYAKAPRPQTEEDHLMMYMANH